VDIDLPLQPKQRELFRLIDESPFTRIGFGGARGGGKSDAARKIMLLRRGKYPQTNGLIVRRTYPELYKNHIEPLFREFPFMRPWYRQESKELTLPNGSKIFFGFAEKTSDMAAIMALFQGSEFADIDVDEATHFSEDELTYMATANRWTGDSSIVPKMLFTMNPGNIGHEYVKRLFIEKSYRGNERASDYAFIQAYGWDNIEWSRALLTREGYSDRDYYGWTDQERFAYFTSNTDYGRALNALPDKQRQANLFGDWFSFAGQYFSNFVRKERAVNAAACARLIKDKFWWPRWASFDWGYAHHSAMYWFATGEITPDEAWEYLGKRDPENIEELIRQNPTRPRWNKNRTIFLTYKELLVAQIGEREQAEKFAAKCDDLDFQRLSRIFIDTSTKQKKGSAHTVQDQVNDVLREHHLPMAELADNERIGGARLMHEVIQSDQWFISEACPEVFSSIPALMHDEDNLEDVLKTDRMSDDVYDSLRYGLKSYLRPRSVPREVQLMEVLQAAPNHTARHMADMKFQVDWAKKHGAIKRPARWR
jgi:hypothetical protein